MKIIDGIPVWGDPVDEGALAQIKTCAKDADHVALMADHHLGYSVPIGGVVAYENFINPAGVGYDIACGNKAVRLDIPAKEVKAKIHKIMDEIYKKISFGVGRANQEDVDHELFDDDAWKMEPAKKLKQKARAQLGTVGSGNHYVDIFTDEEDRIWVGAHFGSRGLGHGIASHFFNALGSKDSIDAKPMLASVNSPVGADYLQLMHLAGKYAYAGRDWVCERVAKILKAEIVEEVHNHHNFAWKESHGGRDLWVVRKGATPAFPGQKGFVGGSMGDISVIIEGVENQHAGESLYSTVHGAGRTMSRTKAAGKKRGGKRTGGDVSHEMMENWVRKKNVVLRGAGTDESPHCYKRLPEVLEQHTGTIRILHTLTPIGVAMAGADEFDPYRD
jgi:tRNA-splicing ligase RtcB